MSNKNKKNIPVNPTIAAPEAPTVPEEPEAVKPGAVDKVEMAPGEDKELTPADKVALKRQALKKAEAEHREALAAEAKANPVVAYEVAPGKSITSKKGIKDAGETVTAAMFSGGLETLETLVKRKQVVPA